MPASLQIWHASVLSAICEAYVTTVLSPPIHVAIAQSFAFMRSLSLGASYEEALDVADYVCANVNLPGMDSSAWPHPDAHWSNSEVMLTCTPFGNLHELQIMVVHRCEVHV